MQLWRIDSSIGVKRLPQTNGIGYNDRGAYRFFGLSPGNYLVSVTYPAERDGPRCDAGGYGGGRASHRGRTGANSRVWTGVRAGAAGAAEHEPRGGLLVSVRVFSGHVFAGDRTRFITISGSEERDGVDMTLALARAAIIRGTISPPAPEGTSITVTLVSAEPMIGNAPSTSVDQTNGTFMLQNVPPGRYTLLVQTRVGSRSIDFGAAYW